MGKFILTKSANGEYRFKLNAANGETILVSQAYIAKANCEKGIASVRINALHDDRFEKKISSNGKDYFNLKAMNGQVIGTSEMYETSASRDGGIASVMNNAPSATIDDKTL